MTYEVSITIETNRIKFNYPEGSIKYAAEKPCPKCSGKAVASVGTFVEGYYWACLQCDYNEKMSEEDLILAKLEKKD